MAAVYNNVRFVRATTLVVRVAVRSTNKYTGCPEQILPELKKIPAARVKYTWTRRNIDEISTRLFRNFKRRKTKDPSRGSINIRDANK